MKKTMLVIILGVLLISLSACMPTEPAQANPAPIADPPSDQGLDSLDVLPQAITSAQNGLTIAVLPQAELISILQYMGKDNLTVRYGLISKFYSDYKLAIDQHFRAYDQHPAVLYYDKLAEISIDEPAAWSLLLQSDFTVDREAFTHHLEMYPEGHFQTADDMQTFFDLLKDFAITSGFSSFFRAESDYYRMIVQDTVRLLPEEDIIGRLEAFFGQGMDSYNVVLVSLFHSGGFGPDLQKNGQQHNYSLIGPTDAQNHLPIFCDEEYFLDLEIHEFGHSFIPIANEASGPFADLVAQSAPLFTAIEEDMKANAYDQWDTALEELILRGCVIKIMEDFAPEQAAALLVEEREKGFIYIDTVCAELAQYLLHREQYTNFNDFIPHVIAALMAAHG